MKNVSQVGFGCVAQRICVNFFLLNETFLLAGIVHSRIVYQFRIRGTNDRVLRESLTLGTFILAMARSVASKTNNPAILPTLPYQVSGPTAPMTSYGFISHNATTGTTHIVFLVPHAFHRVRDFVIVERSKKTRVKFIRRLTLKRTSVGLKIKRETFDETGKGCLIVQAALTNQGQFRMIIRRHTFIR
jgi:hypothetical protein